MPDWFSQNAPTAAAAPVGDWFALHDPKRKPVSAEDFAPAQRDVSVGNMLLNAVKSIPAGIADTAKLLYNDQRPEDVALGPGRVLAPLVRAAGAGAASEAGKVMASKTLSETLGHSLAASLPLIGPAAAAAGEDIGSGDTERIERGGGNAIGMVGGMLAPAVAGKVAPRVSPALATIGEQLAAKGKSVSAAVGKVNPVVLDIASEAAGHALGAPFGASALARRVLAHALDTAKKGAKAAPDIDLPPIPENAGIFPLKPVNAGGQLLRDASGKPVKLPPQGSQELADALEQLRRPAQPDSVELPPPAELPPGYVPRTEAPPVVPSPNAGGRMVPAQTPTTEQALSDALAEARVPEPPARVTTAPEASLPPGYTPRSTVPKARQAKAKLPPQVEEAMAAGERKRAYFLRPKEALAAVAEDAVEPTGSLTVGDLPASWRTHTGQDLFPITGEEGKAVIDGLRAELKARGMSTGQAIASVSKNRSLPTDVRAQLLRALSGGK